MTRRHFDIYRDGRVYIARPMCKTCIYRPGNEEVGAAVIKKALESQTAVVCHSTLHLKHQAVCGGFAAKNPTPLIELAKDIGIVKYTRPTKYT